MTHRARLDHLMGRFSNDMLSVLRAYREEIEFAARDLFGVETEFVSYAALSSAAAIVAHLMKDHGVCEQHAREMTAAVMMIASEICAPADVAPRANLQSVN